MARYTACFLAILLSAASARMLACELSCADLALVSPQACHDQGAGDAPLTQLTDAYSCDHDGIVFTVAASKVTFERFTASVSVASSTSTPATARSIERFPHSPPGRTHDSRTRALTNLRI